MRLIQILTVMIQIAVFWGISSDSYAGDRDSGGSDTVLSVESGTESTKSSFKEFIRSSREKGKGGAGGAFLGVSLIDTDPLRDLISSDHELRKYDFGIEERYQSAVSKGLKGVMGLGKGRRIGGEFSHTSKHFSSSAFNDTVIVLDLDVFSGGIMFEKAFIKKDLNFIAGGMIGVGRSIVERREFDSGKTVFEAEGDKGLSVESNFYMLNIHGGITWSILSLMHIGGNVSVPLVVSESGFEYITDGYVSVMPRLDLNIIIGNIG